MNRLGFVTLPVAVRGTIPLLLTNRSLSRGPTRPFSVSSICGATSNAGVAPTFNLGSGPGSVDQSRFVVRWGELSRSSRVIEHPAASPARVSRQHEAPPTGASDQGEYEVRQREPRELMGTGILVGDRSAGRAQLEAGRAAVVGVPAALGAPGTRHRAADVCRNLNPPGSSSRLSHSLGQAFLRKGACTVIKRAM